MVPGGDRTGQVAEPDESRSEMTPRAPEAPAGPAPKVPAGPVPEALLEAPVQQHTAVRDRDVVLVAASVVAVVLAVNVASGLVPQLDQLLAFAPVVVLAMVTVTIIVLVRSVLSARRR